MRGSARLCNRDLLGEWAVASRMWQRVTVAGEERGSPVGFCEPTKKTTDWASGLVTEISGGFHEAQSDAEGSRGGERCCRGKGCRGVEGGTRAEGVEDAGEARSDGMAETLRWKTTALARREKERWRLRAAMGFGEARRQWGGDGFGGFAGEGEGRRRQTDLMIDGGTDRAVEAMIDGGGGVERETRRQWGGTVVGRLGAMPTAGVLGEGADGRIGGEALGGGTEQADWRRGARR